MKECYDYYEWMNVINVLNEGRLHFLWKNESNDDSWEPKYLFYQWISFYLLIVGPEGFNDTDND